MDRVSLSFRDTLSSVIETRKNGNAREPEHSSQNYIIFDNYEKRKTSRVTIK